jgi:Rrf2 family protein
VGGGPKAQPARRDKTTGKSSYGEHPGQERRYIWEYRSNYSAYRFMLLSLSNQYAITGLARMAALPPGGFCRVEDVVRGTRAPRHAVAKVFYELAKRGILQSVRGTGGGFRLKPSTSSLTLMQVVEAVDGMWAGAQPVRPGLSLPGQTCPLTRLLQPVCDDLQRLLRTTTVGSLGVRGPRRGGAGRCGRNGGRGGGGGRSESSSRGERP